MSKLQKLWPKWQKIGGHCRCRGWLLRSYKWHLETSESLFLWTLSSPSHGHMVGQGNLLNFILPHCYPCPLVIGRAFPFWKVDDFCAVGKDKAFCMSHHLSIQSRRNLEIIQIIPLIKSSNIFHHSKKISAHAKTCCWFLDTLRILVGTTPIVAAGFKICSPKFKIMQIGNLPILPLCITYIAFKERLKLISIFEFCVYHCHISTTLPCWR